MFVAAYEFDSRSVHGNGISVNVRALSVCRTGKKIRFESYVILPSSRANMLKLADVGGYWRRRCSDQANFQRKRAE